MMPEPWGRGLPPPTFLQLRSGESVHPSRTAAIAVGKQTDHWRALVRRFPDVWRCSLDVSRSFEAPWDCDTRGTGYDAGVRDRIAESPTYATLMEAAMHLLRTLGVVVLVCNHGKHRSLSIAWEVASRSGAVLLATRNRRSPRHLCDVEAFLRVTEPYLEPFCELLGSIPHPLEGIRVARASWSGDAWLTTYPAMDVPGEHYLTVMAGDLVILLSDRNDHARGWAFCIRVTLDGHRAPGWLPPAYIIPVPRGHFPDIPGAFDILTALRT